MKRRRVILISAAILLVVAVYLFCLTWPTEPTYKGRKLTSYLRGPWGQVDGPQEDNPHFGPDVAAIRAIGTNGIPTLLKLIQAQDSGLRTRVTWLLKRQSLIQFDLLDAPDRQQLGVFGFQILGELGKPALHELVQLTRHRDPNVRVAALRAILGMPGEREVQLAALNGLLHDPVQRVVSDVEYHYRALFPAEAKNAGVRKNEQYYFPPKFVAPTNMSPPKPSNDPPNS